MSKPMTIKEARKYRYGEWAGLPQGMPYREGGCAYEVWQGAYYGHQCYRKNGYGPGGMYCKQHAKKIEEE